MHVRDLLLDTPHRGSVLVVRVFTQPFDASSMQVFAAVEDEMGGVDELSVYHYDFAGWPDQELRLGTVLALKTPYFRSVIASRGACLTIFHPSDVVVLDQDHELYPAKWKTSGGNTTKTAAQWKAEGNDALKQKKKNYHKANYCYGKGLCVPDLDDELKHDLLRNKAHVELVLGQYDAASTNALDSLLCKPDETSRQLDAKAYYRAGRAFYELYNFQEAEEMFQKQLQLEPSDVSGKRELKRTITRLAEERTGTFDFASMSRSLASTGNFQVEQTSFLSRTEVRQTQDRGRGLFATQPIACGDIVLCEKAFIAEKMPEDMTLQNFIVSPAAKRVFQGGHAETWFRAVQKVFNNPSLAPRLLDLYTICRCPGKPHALGACTESPLVDGMLVVDVFRVMDILESNGYGIMTRADQNQPYPNIPKPQLDAFCDTIGVWTRASYINHSCVGSGARSFLGDFMIVRANRDIPQGEEITTFYDAVTGKYEDLKMSLRRSGIDCSCELCVAEKGWNGHRSPLLDGADSFEKAEPPVAVANPPMPALTARTVPASQLINQVKLYVEQIEETYPLEFFGNVPRIGLAKRHGWLMKAHATDPICVKYAHSVLDDHGFKIRVDVGRSKVHIDRSCIIMTTEVVDAFLCMGIIYEYGSTGMMALSREMNRLGAEAYCILNGSEVGYKALFL
jgi:hypothetical protein